MYRGKKNTCRKVRGGGQGGGDVWYLPLETVTHPPADLGIFLANSKNLVE